MKTIFAVIMAVAILCITLSIRPTQAVMKWDEDCDINKDDKIDMIDIGLVAKAFGCCSGNPRWNATCDVYPEVTGDGVVNMKDITWVACHFGCTPP